MSINFQHMGKRIREQRLRKNLKQEELAWQAGISVPYLSQIETGIKEPSLNVIIRIANALNTTEAYLLFGASLQPPSSALMGLCEIAKRYEMKERDEIVNIVITILDAVKNELQNIFQDDE